MFVMSLQWLLSDLRKLEADYGQQEIRRKIAIARAREIERAGRSHRTVFGKRPRRGRRS